MLANDLLSYSIMQNGEKAVVHALPHYASLTNTKPQAVRLPPINSYVSLTENNLNLLNSFLHKLSTSGSTPPSLTLLSLVLELPFGSPRIDHSTFSDINDRYSIDNLPISIHTHSISDVPSAALKKRRQRLGPSCDNCRSRKVKCNADVVMISRHFTGECNDDQKNEAEDAEEYFLLSPEQKQRLLAGEPVHIDSNYVLVLSNFKLIKYKPCMSCAGKGLACCFSKGFTKEDIVHSKRQSGADETTQSKCDRKHTAPLRVQKRPLLEAGSSGGFQKLSTRKSSCGACRKRKVKCVVLPHGKCVGCAKKDIACTF
ncbi:hypothetical protein METBIDRAFT_44885 [Metschnikowia bicuspidata var. bicuspidata NRRL YB-4993]|uniref:Zn(2)-C6 fungal-type domain-containing protein n=1 Tax=Metschnikowia bicuspidata var. bicuspidata NRRL YB-4993 TaxID=869754 RepID=A0A1A0H7X7_9ASCO|nr:hypothetical protein METBIDRAFT_44885 [Metschnikowia bicuspidata var. bicuspidata NRRL YB-4993]OBA19997.1 hypothetical protein METBIDRAFT_44885 [Metschnikowia bicuspidata var. bicuspidata NRRL YB-4993]